VLRELERKGVVVRRRIGNTYRVWLSIFAPATQTDMLRVGLLPAAEYPHVVEAASRLEHARVRLFRNAIEATRALVMGEVDVCASPLVTQVFFGILTRSIRVLAPVAFNGSGLVLRKGVTPKSYASSELSTMEAKLKGFLREKGVDVYSVNIVYCSSPEEMVHGFRAGRYQALSIWEPYLTILSRERGVRVFRYEEKGEFICCTLAVNVKALSKKEHLIKRFLDEYEKALRLLKSRLKEQATKLAMLTGLDRDLILKGAGRYRFQGELNLKSVLSLLGEYGFYPTQNQLSRVIGEFST